ncbi:5-oxoprolinase/urea amidolyase family protein [Arthrobacter sp. 260]|uniref:5-oxoprolinase subunit B/C family protein n=1 Tax=Arthrobacter sp. 260 TaxID=2735314 RepID=UPI0014910EBC|nr:5-oxoprolinase/urea amidolyase family protein [Arthrobacter sp. 260]NOJ59979.1 5-oxoprolinase/urea amidolyase family protein [Arthrobacter sp. 260]
MSQPEIRWAGPRALLIQLDSLESVLAVHARLQEQPLRGQVDVLAAAQTVLAVFDAGTTARAARTALAHLDTAPATDTAATGDPVRIEVVYDGDDLAEVGRLTGLDPDGVVAAHTGQLWTAAFGGFAPGFAYLVGENETLTVPRRTSPRTAVPAGAVALAGNFSAVYPRRSPGGWQLIGHTASRLWDLDRDQPALLRPGTAVQYVAVRETLTLTDPTPDDGTHSITTPPSTGHSLEVIAPGPQSLIQDLGRPGLGDVGVSKAGAADTASARQANRLVGNAPGDAVIETILGGLTVRAHGELTLALTGAITPAEITPAEIRGVGTSTRTAPMGSPFALHDGETLQLDVPDAGLRTYVAIRGGIDVPQVLGSRSTDVMSGIGPAPLTAATVLPIGPIDQGRTVGAAEPSTLPDAIRLGSKEPVLLRITSGPRHDWFTPASQESLTTQTWTVTGESNRIGVRLAVGATPDNEAPGQPLERVVTDELPSEGVVAGSLQVPPSGLPVLFLADHPVTGGYPVIGVVVPEDLPIAAQVAPGTTLQFQTVDPETLQPTPHPITTHSS